MSAAGREYLEDWQRELARDPDYLNWLAVMAIAATGARGDDAFRVVKVFAKDSLPHNINGSHRFSGDIYFDGSKVVVNSAELHIDDNLLFLASAGNTDDPNVQSGLSNNDTLAGGSGSG